MANIRYTQRERTVKQISREMVIERAEEYLTEYARRMKFNKIRLVQTAHLDLLKPDVLYTVEESNRVLECVINQSISSHW